MENTRMVVTSDKSLIRRLHLPVKKIGDTDIAIIDLEDIYILRKMLTDLLDNSMIINKNQTDTSF